MAARDHVQEESDRQLVLLAIAELALSRPGFNPALELIAISLGSREMFEQFKLTSSDRIRASHGPFGFSPTGPIQFHPDELDYVNAKLFGREDDNSFLACFLNACLRADGSNYPILRPALLDIMKKYPADPERLAAERRYREGTDGAS